MTALASPCEERSDLPTLVDRATTALASARTAAEVLEARELAGFAYDIAKRAARFQRAKDAHDDLIAAAHRSQAQALEIEAQAKHRLADEYDAAQERGDVAGHGGQRGNLPDRKVASTTAEIGLSYRDVFEARQVRDAERAEPGIVRATLDETIAQGKEPTRAALRRAMEEKLERSLSDLQSAQEDYERAKAQPKAPPRTDAQRQRDLHVFGTQEDRAIYGRVDEVLRLIAEQPSPREAVRRTPAGGVHAVELGAIRRAAAWLTDFCNQFEKETPDGIETPD